MVKGLFSLTLDIEAVQLIKARDPYFNLSGYVNNILLVESELKPKDKVTDEEYKIKIAKLTATLKLKEEENEELIKQMKNQPKEKKKGTTPYIRPISDPYELARMKLEKEKEQKFKGGMSNV